MITKKGYISRISIFGLSILVFWITSCDTERKSNNSTDENYSQEIKKPGETVESVAQEKTAAIDLEGEIGLSERWGSGWLDFAKPQSFHTGDSLIIIVGGTADKIVLRLLSAGKDQNSPSGVVGRIHQVNDNGEVHAKLSRDYPNIIQISVHGGENPWGVYPLGASNGAAIIQSATLIK